jgi:putative ABC transport system permease protein
MALPIKYSFKNVIVRWRSTVATIVGVGLTILVYVGLQMMAGAIEASGGKTGDPRNLLIVRRGADSESSSQVAREDFATFQYAEEIARDAEGKPLISADTLVVIYLPRRGGEKAAGGANVIFRGVSPNGPALRPQVKLTEGRMFESGKREIIVSRKLAQRFDNMSVGATVKVGVRELKVVGHFDAGGSAFDSEAWMNADEARALFSRENYCSVLVRPTDEAAGKRLAERLEGDKRLALRTVPETAYYAEQTKTAGPIRFAGEWLAIAMSIGAVLAAMNTMYASVGSRTREIGTLRVLGFRRRTVVLAILLEGAFLATIGGVFGCLLAYGFNGYRAGTFNFQTFGETVFELKLTPDIIGQALLFAAIVGIIGSLLPALRAARMPVIAALKEA